MKSKHRHLVMVLALATCVLAFAVGSAQIRSAEGPEERPDSGAVTEEGQRLLDEGWEVMHLPELDEMRRQRAGRIDSSSGRDIQQREYRREQNRIAPANWGLWSDW